MFPFRGKKASILKVVFWDGNGLCLFNASTRAASCGRGYGGYDGSITLTPAQLAMLIEGIDRRAPERVWKTAIAG
ncbi:MULTISPECIES: transposase [Bradyrhizobium]|uniref:transposase n=1 Tax=Bradyrhizobium TaxID=374 RepID=UPI001FCA6771|nr:MULTISPECIES: transposase [Bradyrhizobium]